MPIGVPRIIYCWGEELPAQWTDIYNFIFRRRMVFLMQYLDDELCNQICGLLINIHMEDRSKDLERKEMERSGVFKSGSSTPKQGSVSEKTKGRDTTSSSQNSSFTNSSVTEGRGSAFYNKKSRSMEDLLNADEDLGIDEIDTLEQHTLQKITTEWLNWNAQFFDYSDEPYLFYLAELLSKDFNKGEALSGRVLRIAAPSPSLSSKSETNSLSAHSTMNENEGVTLAHNKIQNEIVQLLNMLKNNSSYMNKSQPSRRSPSGIYAPFRTHANFSPGNFALKDVNSLTGKAKLYKLFKDYKKKGNSIASKNNSLNNGEELNVSSLVGDAGLLRSPSMVDHRGSSSIVTGVAKSSSGFAAQSLTEGASTFKERNKYIYKFLSDLVCTLPLKKERISGQVGTVLRGEATNGNLPLEKLQKHNKRASSTSEGVKEAPVSSKSSLNPSKGGVKAVLQKKSVSQEKALLNPIDLKQSTNFSESKINVQKTFNKVLSQRNLRREYSLDDNISYNQFSYNSNTNSPSLPLGTSSSDNKIVPALQLIRKKGDKSFNYVDSSATSSQGNYVDSQGKNNEFRDYYRKQTERALMEEESKKVFVIINSFGGSVGNGVTVHDALQFIKAGSLTLGLGVAASAASLALAGGTIGERYVTEGCHVMIHQPESSLQGQASDIWIDSQEIMKIRLDVAEIYSLSTYRPRHKILRDLDRDFYLTATETIQYGLADEIATNEVMSSIIEMTNNVWDYHDSKQQSLLETRIRQQEPATDTQT